MLIFYANLIQNRGHGIIGFEKLSITGQIKVTSVCDSNKLLTLHILKSFQPVFHRWAFSNAKTSQVRRPVKTSYLQRKPVKIIQLA